MNVYGYKNKYKAYIIILSLNIACSVTTIKGPILDNQFSDFECKKIFLDYELKDIEITDEYYSLAEQKYFGEQIRKDLIEILSKRCGYLNETKKNKRKSIILEIKFYRITQNNKYFLINVFTFFILDLILKNSYLFKYEIQIVIKNVSNEKDHLSGNLKKLYLEESISVFEKNEPGKVNAYSVLRNTVTKFIIEEIIKSL